MKEGYCMNPETNRIISKKTAKYKRLVKLGLIVEDEPKVEKVKETPKEPIKPKPEPVVETKPEPEEEEEPFDERKLQEKLSEISTDMIQQNLKKVVRAQRLSDSEMDILLKKLLYQKLVKNKPKEEKKVEKKVEKKTKKKAKFKIIEPSSSESESESD